MPFPFSGDELYGQHVHVTLAQAPSARTVHADVLHTGGVRHALATDRRHHPAHQHAWRISRRRARVHRSRGLAQRRASVADARGPRVARASGEGRGSRRTSCRSTKPSTSPSCSLSATRSIDSSARRSVGAFEPMRRARRSTTLRSTTRHRRRRRPRVQRSAPEPDRRPARPVVPPDEEPDRRRLLHVPRRACSRSWDIPATPRWPASPRATCESTDRVINCVAWP